MSGNTYNCAELLMLLFSFLILLYPLAVRTCGADTDEYFRIYIRDYTDAVDFTFNYLCKGLHCFIASPRIGLGIISACTLLLVFYAFENVKQLIDIKYAFFAYFTMIYFYLYNYMRIMIAVSLILLGYSFIVKGNRIKPLIPFLIAVLFHRSAGVVLVVYMAAVVFEKFKRFVIPAATVLLGAFLMKPWAFLSLISLDHYSSQMDYTAVTSNSIGLGTTLRVLPFFVLLLLYRQYKDEFVYSMTVYFCFANLAFSYLGYFVSTASRLSNMYFIFHTIYFIPWIIKRDSNRIRRMIVGLGSIAYYAFNYYLLTLNFTAMKIMPYS